MRKLLYLIFALILIACTDENDTSETNTNIATIKGTIEKPDTNFVVFNKVRYDKLANDTIYLEDNKFHYNISIEEGQYLDLRHGESVYIYVEPQDTLKIKIDSGDLLDNITFEGSRKNENDYLRKKQILAENEPGGRDLFEVLWSKEYPEFRTALADIMSPFHENFNKLKKNESISEEFISLESKLLKFKEFNYKSSYPQLFSMYNDYEVEAETPDDFLNLDFVDELEYPNLLALDAYSSFVNELSTQLTESHLEGKEEGELIDLIELGEMTIKKYQDSTIRSFIFSRTFGYFINMGMDQYSDEVFDWYADHLDKRTIDEVNEKYNSWKKLDKGNLAKVISGYNLENELVKTSDFKGNYLYIDVWATWCGPCRGEIPHLEELQEKYSDENITFMSVSTDQNYEAWESMVTNDDLKGTQIIMKDDEQFDVIRDDFLVFSIPRFILIDTEGKIIDANAPRPSGNIADVFDELLSSEPAS